MEASKRLALAAGCVIDGLWLWLVALALILYQSWRIEVALTRLTREPAKVRTTVYHEPEPAPPGPGE